MPAGSEAADRDDVALITCLREGDETAARVVFDRLYSQLFERLFRFATRLLSDADLARDAVQDTFVHLWISRAKWYAPGGSVAYLYAAVRNQALKRIRHRQVVARAAPERLPRPAREEMADTAIEARDFDHAFRAALLQLSERRRTAFLLHAVDGLSYEAIGQILDVSKPAAFKQVAAAIDFLRKQLSRFSG